MLAGVTADLQSQQIANIYKRLAAVQNSGSLSNRACSQLMRLLISDISVPVIPYILNDIKAIFQSYGKSGNIDPFEAIHKVSFYLLQTS